MQVFGIFDDSQRRWRPGSVAAAFMLVLAGAASTSYAVEFDERVKAPRALGSAELTSMAQGYSDEFARAQAQSPRELATNAALSRARFELKWQFERAIDARQPLGDVAALGLAGRDDGVYDIDYNKYPQWFPFDEMLATLLPSWNLEGVGAMLTNRGFREAELEKLRSYVAAHDVRAAAAQRTLPIALGFSKFVKKLDKIRRPVTTDMVFAYLYQRNQADAEARHDWARGLIEVLDPQSTRILHSYFAEMPSAGAWGPSDREFVAQKVLGEMRLPNFEQLATAKAREVAP